MDADWLSQDCVYVDKRDPVSKIEGWIRGAGQDVPIVRDDGRPYAIIHPRAITAGGWHNDTMIEKLAWPVPVIRDGDDVDAAARRFIDSGAPYLPARIGRPPRSAGYLDAGFLLYEGFTEGPGVKEATVPCPTVPEDGTILDALKAFGRTNIDALPVVGDGLVGVIHRSATVPHLLSSDFGEGRQDLAAHSRSLFDDPVVSRIDHDATTIDVEAGFDDAQSILRDHGEAIVVDGARVVGSLTPTWMLLVLYRPEKQGMPPLHFRQPKAPR